ncbi:hypothetical protein ABIA16_005371 [Sinorhizobium fredii]
MSISARRRTVDLSVHARRGGPDDQALLVEQLSKLRHAVQVHDQQVWRIQRWEQEHHLEAMQARLDADPDKMRQRRVTAEHPFGTIKSWMGATHFLTKRLPNVRAEMALHVLAYNMTRVMNIIGSKALVAAIQG